MGLRHPVALNSEKTAHYHMMCDFSTNDSRSLSRITCHFSTAHELFGSPDLPDFQVNVLSDGDSVYSPENLFEIVATPATMCLICKRTPLKTCWKFWQS